MAARDRASDFSLVEETSTAARACVAMANRDVNGSRKRCGMFLGKAVAVLLGQDDEGRSMAS